MLSTLEIVLIFLAAAVGVVALARKLRLPPILGYLAARHPGWPARPGI